MAPPNILLVVLDSTRAQNCGLHGYGRETTPFLRSLADESIVYEHAKAPSIHSISSHTSIFTGYHTEQHEITEHKSFVKPDATIWRRLSKGYDYDTGIFTANVIVTQTSNLGQTFDTCVGPKRANFRLFDTGLSPLDVQGDVSVMEYLRTALTHEAPVRSVLNGVYKKLESRGGSQNPDSENASVYIGDLLDWIETRSGPWAACLNLMDTHTPFAPNSEFDTWSDSDAREARAAVESGSVPDPFTDAFWRHLSAMESLYDGTIRQADAAIEWLVEALEDAGLLDNTLLVITSDHGEGLGEQSALDPSVRLRHHSWGIDEVLTHVPLLVRPPGGDSGRRVRRPASLTEFPSVVEDIVDGDAEAAVADGFVPDGDVVSSTFRIAPPGDELALPEDERAKYFGPWRAVYRTAGDAVIKYARRGDAAVTIDVTDPQNPVTLADTDDGVVAPVFDEFHSEGVRLGMSADREMEDNVEERLSDLGYLR